ncbi:hypothetical protein QBC35DRAFT_504095, partial [Podospora australis]
MLYNSRGRGCPSARAPVIFDFVPSREKDNGIHLQSQNLLRALRSVTSPLTDAKETGCFLPAPCGVLFYHLDEMGAEIEKMNDPEAKLDFQAVEWAAMKLKSVWDSARAEIAESPNVVRYENMWRLFKPGDLVVHTDDFDSEWLLVLTEVKYNFTQASKFPPGPGMPFYDQDRHFF